MYHVTLPWATLGYLWIHTEPFLSNLTLDQDAVQTYTKSYDGHPSNSQPGHLSTGQPISPTSLVIYVVCDGDSVGKHEAFHVFHTLSKLVSSESIKQKTRDQALIQVLVHVFVCVCVCMCVYVC